MANAASDDRQAKLLGLMADGVSLRAAAAAVGIPKSTASDMVRSSRSGPSGIASNQGTPGVPFSGAIEPPASVPPLDWNNDQTAPPPDPLVFREGYHDRSFRQYMAPLAFDGWDLDRVRNAISMHCQGIFLESSQLAIAVSRFGPVTAALKQRVAPALGRPRQVHAGTRGLSKVLGREIERQLAPRLGLRPSPYFPPILWGSIGIDLAMMGFSVLQHAYGAPNPDTGIRMVYTRRWPTWAVQYWRPRRTFIAMTTEGPVDIISGDGKFTLVADSEEPHLEAAIIPLGEEALDGKSTQRARASYVDKYGNPKWVGIMPQGVAVRSKEGDAFFDALATIRGPDGYGAIPFGSQLDIRGLTSGQSDTFKDALESNWQYVAAILLGSDGTMTRGTGVYSAPIFAGVRRDLVERDLKAEIRAVNCGHVAPWLAFNYASSIAEARGWIDPVFDIPLPDPDADARIESIGKRTKMFIEIQKAKADAGFEVSQDSVDEDAATFEIEAPKLAVSENKRVPIDVPPTERAKVVKVRELRSNMGLEPLGTDRDDALLADLDKTQPEGEQGSEASGDEPVATEATEGEQESSSEATDHGGTSTGGKQGKALAGEFQWMVTFARDDWQADIIDAITDRTKMTCPHCAGVIRDESDVMRGWYCIHCGGKWEESKHPRKGGKFAKKGEGDGGAKREAEPKRPAAKKTDAQKKKEAAKKAKEKEREKAKRAKAKEAEKKRKAKEKTEAAKRKTAKKPAKNAAPKRKAAKKPTAKPSDKKPGTAEPKKKSPTPEPEPEKKPEKKKLDPDKYKDIQDDPKPEKKPAKSGTHPHDPEHWEEHYKHLGYAAKHAAYGHAMNERGLDMPPKEAADHLRGMAKRNKMFEEAVWYLEDLHSRGYKSIRELKKTDPEAGAALSAITALAAHSKELKASGGTMSAKGQLTVNKETMGNELAMGMVKSARDFYQTFAASGRTFGKVSIQLEPGRARAAYYPSKNKVAYNASPGSNPAVIEHELGHCLAGNNKDISDAASEFFHARTKGETLQPIKTKKKADEFYGKEEVCLPDKFMSRYMGRVYSDESKPEGTEIVSMACEYLAREPHTLFTKDPEMFHFILGALKGVK